MHHSNFTVRCLWLCVLAFGWTLPAQAQSADLAITKTGPTTANADTDVVYTVTVLNTGPDDAASVVMSDPVPAGMTFVSAVPSAGSCDSTVTCTLGSLTSGGSATYTITLHIPPGTPAGTLFVNSASVLAQTPDDTDENNTALWGTQVASVLADVAIGKTGPANAIADSDIVYTLSVSNFGPNPATGVSWTDTLPAPLTFVSLQQQSGPAFTCTPGATSTCSISTLAAGVTATFSLVAHVPSATASGTSFSNHASVTSDHDPNDENNNAVAATTVSSADVAVVKSAPATAIAGGAPLSYTIVLSNNGPDTATQARFTDLLPPGTTFVSLVQDTGPAAVCASPAIGSNGTVSCSIALLADAASAQFTLSVAIPANIANGTTVSNTATAATDNGDPNPSNDSSMATTTVATQADLAVSKTGPANAIAGGTASYVLGLINNGPSDAASVNLSDTLPPGTTFVSLAQTAGPAFNCTTPAVGTGGTVTCTAATLASGVSASFTLVVAVTTAVANGSTLSNTATASSATTDPSPNNNSAVATTTVANTADVVISKSAPPTVTAGQNLIYTLSVANQGASPANAVQWSDTLPPGTTFVLLSQDTGPNFICTTPTFGASGTVTCNLGTLAAGANATFTLVVAVASEAADGTTLTNTATAQTNSVDANPANNSAFVTTSVGVAADLLLNKTASSASLPLNSNIVYTLGIVNFGPSSASTVTLLDTLPSGTHFVALTQTSGPAFTCTRPAVGSGGDITCTIAALASGANAYFTLTVDTIGLAPGNVVNTASVSAATPDPVPSNNAASASVTLASPPPVAAPALSWQMLWLTAFLVAALARRRWRAQ